MQAATDLAAKVGKEAEAAMAEAEARASARRQATDTFKAAMDILPVTSATTWDKVGDSGVDQWR